MSTPFFHRFTSSIEAKILPEKLNFPFYYEPHPLATAAVSEIQQKIIPNTNWQHDFGDINPDKPKALGKMFGVLVVQNPKGEIGYLAGFSGKIGDSNQFPGFVPPIFDLLEAEGHFKEEESKINAMNREIEELESSEELQSLQNQIRLTEEKFEADVQSIKKRNRAAKIVRDQIRKNTGFDEATEQKLAQESIQQALELKQAQKSWKSKLKDLQEKENQILNRINELKKNRAERSNELQNWLFEQYELLNSKKEKKNLVEIFREFNGLIPPAGSGECAAPKLFQYAYLNELKPITFAEFWWGKSPNSAIRKHQQFYPSCRSKCEPILNHMLKGLKMDPNPMLANPAEGKKIAIVYQDDFLAVINKPHDFLSVPGKNISDSVYERAQHLFADAEGPIIVHRLDMSTSGLMILAKSKSIHEHLQKQFLKKTVQKRYLALLEGNLTKRKGRIELPLRVDLDNRPQQLVCYEHGKSAITDYEVIKEIEGKTWIHFYPITGRTHQLRVHAAHPNGLNAPIKGDDLYGKRNDRLYLQAQKISFIHPKTKDKMVFELEPEF